MSSPSNAAASSTAHTHSGRNTLPTGTVMKQTEEVVQQKEQTGVKQVKDIVVKTEDVRVKEDQVKPDHDDGASDKDEKAPTLPEIIMNTIQYLKEETLYLASPSTRSKVAWLAENRSHRLVVQANDNVNSSYAIENQRAILTLITAISHDDCFLASDGSYKGATTFTSSLADIKLSCVGSRPSQADLAVDFGMAMMTINDIMDEIRTAGYARQGVTLPSGSANPNQLKFRHVLFKESGTSNVVIHKGAPPIFHISNWPVSSPTAKRELADMQDTHTVVPLPAYDEKGDLISPLEYRTKLKGALVVLQFDLEHWSFTAKDGRMATDTFVANIHRIDVLRGLPPVHQSASKHVLDMHDPLPSAMSPNKRQKRKL